MIAGTGKKISRHYSRKLLIQGNMVQRIWYRWYSGRWLSGLVPPNRKQPRSSEGAPESANKGQTRQNKHNETRQNKHNQTNKPNNNKRENPKKILKIEFPWNFLSTFQNHFLHPADAPYQVKRWQRPKERKSIRNSQVRGQKTKPHSHCLLSLDEPDSSCLQKGSPGNRPLEPKKRRSYTGCTPPPWFFFFETVNQILFLSQNRSSSRHCLDQ